MSEEIRVVIVDDEPIARQILKRFVGEHKHLNLVGEASNTKELQNLLKTETVDVMFLDIRMPGRNGIDFLQHAKQIPLAVIVSSYENYAAEAFDLDVVDYLRKPVRAERFAAAVERIQRRFTERKASLIIKVDHQNLRVNFSDIDYIEGYGDYLKIYCNKQMHLTRSTFKELSHQLDERFLRIHRSYAINRDKIDSFTSKQVKIHGVEIPISDKFDHNLLRA